MDYILIKNGLIVNAGDAFRADLLIYRGVIARIGADLEQQDATVIDAKGCYVIPGGVDAHTHLNLTAKGVKVGDGFFLGTVSAAFGGTTCVVEHPGFGPVGCSLLHQLVHYQEEARGQAVVDYGLHAVFQHVDAKVLDEMAHLAEKGVPTGKIYLTYDGRLDDREILEVLDRAHGLGLLTAFHAENDGIIRFLSDKLRAEGKFAPVYHALSRPDCCEAEAIQRILHLAEAAGNVPVYVVHLSTARGLRAIEEARQRGLTVYAEVCPQHLLLDDSCYLEPEYGGLKYIMAPPARKKEDAAALWHGLETGSIDAVATDHCSFNFADKLALGKEDFSKCPGGIPGVETRLPLIFSEGVLKGRLSLSRFVDVVSTAPAKIMGLYPRKGILAPGSDGDVVIFDPVKDKTITPAKLHHNADYSPYEGMSVKGWPVATLVRGHVVVEHDRLLAEKGWGEYVPRHLMSDTASNKETTG
ncbi:MAG TPA: dihydropyrimidinase [Syntrophobacteraceae bacterium]|nr:dihydropyrimidinase [Syntrophobacteraceae bacterium]